MSALAWYLEEEGIATTSIALYRRHAVAIAPPRALWVPFELGQPLGPPGDAAFQRRVIDAALALLERDDGPPLLADFADESPAKSNPAWTAPAVSGADSIEAELALVRGAYERAVAATGRTSVGMSGVDIGDAARYLNRFGTADAIEKPRRDLADVQMVRFAIDDVKACWLEAAVGTGNPMSSQLADWFWRETHAARRIIEIRGMAQASDDKSMQFAQNWLVPEHWVETLGLAPGTRESCTDVIHGTASDAFHLRDLPQGRFDPPPRVRHAS